MVRRCADPSHPLQRRAISWTLREDRTAKLRKFTVKEFKSIWDSGPIEVDDSVTCLVGKNESGKTALLTALYRTNPIIPEDGCFNLTYDYPKREVEDYRFAVEKGDRQEAVVVDCVYELEAEDKAVVADTFGAKTLENDELRHLTYYGERPSGFQLVVNDQAAREHLASNSGFPARLQDSLKAAPIGKTLQFCLATPSQTTPSKHARKWSEK
ncbi:MAG: AAA family ATPase [Albidovulum sp.]|nr:AAA family ATPase [Albidovulum sp.]